MKHKCISCEEVIELTEEQLNSGCPECDGNKFRIVKENEQKENEVQSEARSGFIEGDFNISDITGGLQTRNDTEPSDDEEEVIQDGKEVSEILSNTVEGVTVVEPGEYKLNLEKIYKNQDNVIRVEEDGKFIISFDE